jgi:hypothetical protein
MKITDVSKEDRASAAEYALSNAFHLDGRGRHGGLCFTRFARERLAREGCLFDMLHNNCSLRLKCNSLFNFIHRPYSTMAEDIGASRGAMPPSPAAATGEEDDRILKDHPPIPRHPLARAVLFPASGPIDLPAMKTHLLREGRLAKTDAIDLIKATKAVLSKEPNLLRLRDPIAVCGDLHGQFYDLVKLLEVAGDPAKTQYLFLGDYVDRGCFSTECLFYLFALKLTYPKTLFLLRGNHECRHLTAFFNFKEECRDFLRFLNFWLTFPPRHLQI